jgi:hypothetical protein
MNTAVGTYALQSNSSGSNNTAIGRNAMGSNANGIRNTALGESSMFSNLSGNDNTAVGISSLALNTSGSNNVAVGSTTLQGNVSGTQNAAVGSGALSAAISSTNTIAIGRGALGNAGKVIAVTAVLAGGTYNIQAVGNTDFTLIGAASNTVGATFTATGPGAGTGTALAVANDNIAIGTNAAGALVSGSNNIALGSYINDTESSTIRIGTIQTRAIIAGIRGATTGFNNAIPVLIDGAGQLGTANSSARFKDNIADMGDASAGLMALRPVTFHYKADQSAEGRTLQYGLIAEEVAEVYPKLVARSADGQIETVMYQYLPPMLLNEIQKQQRTIAAQAARLAELEERLARMERLGQMQANLPLRSVIRD